MLKSQLSDVSGQVSKKRHRFLLKHLGNMGDHLFFIPPILETLKRVYPDCHVTLVTAWGFKEEKSQRFASLRSALGRGFGRRAPSGGASFEWGARNQGGFCISLMMTNPHIDQLVHWHDTELSLEGKLCVEEDQHFPTWNRDYFEKQKESSDYDGVYELDFGIGYEDNPIQKMYEALGLPGETFSNYKLYLTDKDREVAAAVMQDKPRPRIVLLEGIAGETTRGWNPDNVQELEMRIEEAYGVLPIWFGGKHIPEHEGLSLTLRENIATLAHCDVGIGVMSGPLHFAASVGLPTITLYCDQPLHRAAPAYFLNKYIQDKPTYTPSYSPPANTAEKPTLGGGSRRKHRTILGPSPAEVTFLKSPEPPDALTKAELVQQGYKKWTKPGKQSTKSCLAPITVDEVMLVLNDTLGTV